MPDISNLGFFIGACLVILLVPGPAVLYIVARSAAQGVRAGLVSVAGIHLGTVVHIAAAVLGLSAIVATSATAFRLVKWLGAAYLVYLGVRTFWEGAPILTPAEPDPRALRKVFWDGAIVNALNPKTAIFFLAFVPQFVDPASGSVPLQLVTLGLVFTVIGFVTDSLFAVAAGRMGRWLRRHPGLAARQHWFAGTSYLGLGVTAAITD